MGATDSPRRGPQRRGQAEPRRARLEHLLRQQEERSFPLSFAQHRMWLLDQLAPGNPAYNVHAAFRLRGRCDEAALESALARVVERQGTLRTTYVVLDGVPRQRVGRASGTALPRVDLRALPAARRDEECRRRAAAEAGLAFHLTAGPPLRLLLLRLDGEALLLVTLHHIAADGWSLAVFLRDLGAFYSELCGAAPAGPPALAVQYVDYVEWQRRWLEGKVMDGLLAYWRQRLADAPPWLELPTDRPRPSVQSFRGARRALTLGPDLGRSLGRLARGAKATPFMVLFTAFQVLLGRYCGQTDLVVGSPVANRRRPELEDLVGLFVDTLALRVDLTGDPPFVDLLERVRESTLAALAHQDLPFDLLVEALAPARDAGRPPLVQVLFALLNAPAPALDIAGLQIRPMEVDAGVAQLDLALYAREADGDTGLSLIYCTALFDATTAGRMLEHFRCLLASIAAEPGRRLSALDLLTPAERHQIAVEVQGSGPGPDVEACIHELVVAQAARRPEAVAVTCGRRRLTYRSLAERAGGLARHLRARGIGRGARVGICLDRSVELVVALTGVLSAGAAYVPLDPSHPAERLARVLEDARPRLVLTSPRLAAGLDRHGIELLPLHAGWRPAVSGKGERHGDGPPGPDDAAYVIYTSGSTGRPKGVEVTHRGVVACLRAIGQELDLAPRDTMLGLTTVAFDIAVLEIFLPLLSGAHLLLEHREVPRDAALVARRLDRGEVTVAQATPSTWRLLLRAGWRGDGRLAVLCGGEPLHDELARQLRARGGSLHNLYGPTETTIWSSAQRVTAGGEVTLGRPLAGTRMYVLDPAGRLLPAGVPGELHIAGAGVSRGYPGEPALTAVRFLPDPFGREPGARLYATRDRVRLRADGSFDFLGRLDRQVKVRGHRVELEEVERALELHPAVRQAVAAVREDAVGDQRLVAWVVPAAGAAPPPGALREMLARALPGAMVPSVYVVLDALPRTPNGKIDRRALPDPGELPVPPRQRPAPPRTPTEEMIAALWQSTLRGAAPGVHDDFFEAGGHSLTAAQLLWRVKEHLAVDLTLRDFFAAPTVEGLAAAVERELLVQAGAARVEELMRQIAAQDQEAADR